MEDEILEAIEKKLDIFYSKHDLVWSLDQRIGHILFLAHNSLEKKPMLKEKVYSYMEEAIGYFSENLTDSTFFNGFTGLGWLMQHLYNLKILGIKDLEVLRDLDSFVELSLERDFQTQNLDFLYGLVGKGIYFLERYPTVDTKRQLEQIFQYYSNLSNSEHSGVTAYLETSNNYSINLGLAHGVPNVIVFLSKLYKKGICKEEAYKELIKLVDWILKQRIEESDIGSFSWSTGDTKVARVAWCYGDLGVALALQHALGVIKQNDLKNAILNILKKTTKRKLSNSGVASTENNIEKGLCHGIAGIAHMYHKFSNLYDDIEIKNAYKYWYNMLINDIDMEDDFLGCYKYQLSDDESKNRLWVREGGLLDGLVGIGLTILSKEQGSTFQSWDSVLLMDIE